MARKPTERLGIVSGVLLSEDMIEILVGHIENRVVRRQGFTRQPFWQAIVFLREPCCFVKYPLEPQSLFA